MKRNTTMNMLAGPLFPNIVRFSIPLVFSNLLQVLFNMSDVAVVGRFAGSDALGSVGSCTIVVSLFTGLLLGMGGGVNAMTARYVGAGERVKLRKTVHTALLISVLFGLVVMGVGLLTARPVLQWMNTNPELLDGAVLYLTVYLLGTPAVAIYNYGSGVLSAKGDPKRPLRYLLIAGVVNVLLNLFFVIVLRLSILGVAMASAISQYLSALLILRRMAVCGEDDALQLRELKIDRPIAGSLLLLGLPAGFQNAIFAIANLFIQSAVNSLDTVMVKGNAAAANADTLVYDMMAAVYVACTTFVGQNYGAGQKKRMKKSYMICTLLSFVSAAAAGLLLLLFGRPFLSLFTEEEAVISAGIKRMEIMACSYCVSAFMDCTIAAARGIGKTVIPTLIVIAGSCVFRIIWIYTVFAYFGTIPSLYLLYVFSWGLTGLFEVLYFISAFRRLPGEAVET